MATALVSALAQDSGAPRRGDDRGDHPARPGAADRRPEGEDARRAPRGHQDRPDPQGEPEGPEGDPARRSATQLRIVPVEYVDDVLREALVLEKPEEFFKRATPVAVVEEPKPEAVS